MQLERRCSACNWKEGAASLWFWIERGKLVIYRSSH